MKNLKAIVISIISLWIIYFTLRQTYVLQIVRIASNSNEPTLKKGSILFASRISKPSLLDFCLFENIDQYERPVWVFRITGMPGDTVEIKQGVLYVNNKNLDTAIKLSHSYKIRIMDTINLDISDYSVMPNTDSIVTSISDYSVFDNNIPTYKYILPRDSVDTKIKDIYNQNWNRDNFGPIIVPTDSFFLLGDNRSEAIDSRYLGFINVDSIKGCILFKR